MNSILENNSVALALSAAVFMLVMMVTLAVMTYIVSKNKESRYAQEYHRAVLSSMRDSYEGRIGELNREMTATPERWRDANHLLLSAQSLRSQNQAKIVVGQTDYLSSLGFRAPDYVIDPKLILVLTPFAEEERETFETVQRVCSKAGFRCVRGDEEYTPSDVLTHVVRLIVKARIVIANVSSRNPNVFYELGVAQALGKQTILIAERLQGVPFDIANQRILIWQNKQELEKTLTESLLKAMAEAPVN